MGSRNTKSATRPVATANSVVIKPLDIQRTPINGWENDGFEAYNINKKKGNVTYGLSPKYIGLQRVPRFGMYDMGYSTTKYDFDLTDENGKQWRKTIVANSKDNLWDDENEEYNIRNMSILAEKELKKWESLQRLRVPKSFYFR
jgi:hypothetical protein